MEMIPVSSSNVVKVGWEPNQLHMEFKSGGTYSYADVPQQLFTELLESDSVGKFFHARIKDRFVTEKVSSPG